MDMPFEGGAMPAPPTETAPVETPSYTYEQLKEAGWTDDQLLAHPEYASLVPSEVPSAPTPSPVPEPVINNPIAAAEQEMMSEPTPVETPVDPTPVEAPVEPTAEVNVTPSFSPTVAQESIIGEITPANFDNMMKVLNVLIKERTSDSVIIRDSQIKQGASDCVIEADMSQVLNYNGNAIDLDIINPKKYVSLFNQFRNQNNIFIVDDPDNSRFIITNGEVRLFLPKQDDVLQQTTESINLENASSVCKSAVDKDTRKIIKGLAKDCDYVEYLIQDDNLKGMHIPDTAVYIFEEYQKDPKAVNLDETNADLILRSSNFLPIDADGYDINIYKLPSGDYASITDCKIGGQIDVRIAESCDIATGGNIVI